MANEFKHKDPCTTLTQAEYIGACGDGHIFACQAIGDIVYADSSTVLKRLGKGATNEVLQIVSCKPDWVASPTIGSTGWANANHAHAASNSGGTVCANVLAGTTLKSTVVNSSLENVGTLTALQVDFINANASTVTITDSTDTGDLASLAVTTHGATTLTTTDDDAAAAHFTVDADGNITLDSATGIVTIEDGGTEVLRFTESCSGDVTIKLVTNAKDLIFTDNGDAEGFRILDAAAGVNVAGLLTAGSLDIDNVLINGTTIGHTCDTDLMTIGNAALTVKGTVTVGVDGTGHDVKLFGCAAGAYMEWDESANLLEIRGATAAGPGHLKLTTGETTVVANDVLGRIDFQAPLEADCSADARLVGASIAAVAQGTFADALNATDIVFYTGHSEAATEKFRFTSQGEIGIAGANYGTDGQVLTSTGGGTAVAWEDAGGGISNVVEDTSPQLGGNLDMQARLLVGNGGTTGIAISAAGEVTMAASPAFLTALNADEANKTGGGTAWLTTTGTNNWTDVFDQNADVSADGLFTAPVTGIYQLGIILRMQGITTAMTYSDFSLVTNAGTYTPYELDVGNTATIGSAGEWDYHANVLADMSAGNTAYWRLTISNGADVVDIQGTGVQTVMYGRLAN